MQAHLLYLIISGPTLGAIVTLYSINYLYSEYYLWNSYFSFIFEEFSYFICNPLLRNIFLSLEISVCFMSNYVCFMKLLYVLLSILLVWLQYYLLKFILRSVILLSSSFILVYWEGKLRATDRNNGDINAGNNFTCYCLLFTWHTIHCSMNDALHIHPTHSPFALQANPNTRLTALTQSLHQ